MGSFLSSNPKTESKIHGQVVIVTGANRGIGFETAKQLYELGATVYLGSRTEDHANEAIKRIQASATGSGGELKWLPVDLSTIKKARESGEGFLKMESKLDVLVNNAALSATEFAVNEDGVETTMAINHIGHFVFTTTLLDLMKQTSVAEASDVRIVVVASYVHDLWNKTKVSFADPADLKNPFPPKDYDSWSNMITRYGRSKLANILFTSELQRRLDAEGSNIVVVCVHPGKVSTDTAVGIFGKMPILGHISNLLVKLTFVDGTEGARNSVFGAANPVIRAEPEKYKGKYLMPIGQVTIPSALAQDVELSKQLWSLTEQIVEANGKP